MSLAVHRFCHLGAHSEFSVGESIARIEDLCREAARDGQRYLALTDVNTVAGLPRFQRAAVRAGLRPVLGMELSHFSPGQPDAPAASGRVRLLVESLPGWRTLLRLGNRARLGQGGNSARAVTAVPFAQLLQETRGLFLLIGGQRGELTRLLAERRVEEAESWMDAVLGAWPTERVLVELPDPVTPESSRAAAILQAVATHYGLRSVAVPRVNAAHVSDIPALSLLRKDTAFVKGDRKPTRLVRPPHTIGELWVPEQRSEHLASAALASQRFADFPEALRATEEVAEACASFLITPAEKRFPIHDFTRGVDAESFIWNASFERATARYGELPTPFKERLNQEFRMISEAGLCNALVSLFRLHEELDRQGVLRAPGSGVFTGSVVASLLGVTRLDPLRFQLPFQLPEDIGSSFPPLEFSLPEFQEREATRALVSLFAGQVCAIGTWSTWREFAAAEHLAVLVGMDSRERARLRKDTAFAAAWEEELRQPASHPIAADTPVTAPEALAWLTRRLEGRVRSPQALPGRFTFSVEDIEHSLPLRALPGAGPGDEVTALCEWSEDEVHDLRFGTARFQNPAVLNLVGGATAVVRSSGKPQFAPESVAPDDAGTYRVLREGRVAGIAPLDLPILRRELRQRRPVNLYEFAGILESEAAKQHHLRLPELLLAHSAAAIKAHEPVAFYSAALTQAETDTRRLAALLEEIHGLRIPVQPLDVNCSGWEWSAEGRAIRPGFCVVRDLSVEGAEELIRTRRELAFTDLADVLRRTDASLLRNSHVEALVRAGAMDGFGVGRSQLLAQLEQLAPLLRPKRGSSSSSDDPLSFFGQGTSWWLETQVPTASGSSSGETALPREWELEREATSGVFLHSARPSREEEFFIAQSHSLRAAQFSPRMNGSLVSIVGRVDAIEPTGEPDGAMLADVGGCLVRLTGDTARLAAAKVIAGKWCLAAGKLHREENVWVLEGELFHTIEAWRMRSAQVRALVFNLSSVTEAEVSELHRILRRFTGPSPVRLEHVSASGPKAQYRLGMRRVLSCPLLDLELRALLGEERWHFEEQSDQSLLLTEAGRSASSLVRKVFSMFGK